MRDDRFVVRDHPESKKASADAAFRSAKLFREFRNTLGAVVQFAQGFVLRVAPGFAGVRKLLARFLEVDDDGAAAAAVRLLGG